MPRAGRFAWGVLLANVAVILWGGFVRATGSGAGCGSHWPTCNGTILQRAPSTATLIELSHRFTSGVAFFAVAALLLVTYLGTGRGHRARRWALFAMAFMFGEVVIGAAIVVLGHVALDPSVMHGVFTVLHAGNTFLLLGALTMVADHLSRPTDVPVVANSALPASTLRARRGSLIQAFTGLGLTFASGAIAGLGDTLFPVRSLTEGFAQDLTTGAHLFLHIRTLHPVFAIVAFVLVLGASVSLRLDPAATPRGRFLAGLVILAVSCQMALGLLNLWLLVPIPTQLLHLALADVVFILLVLTAAEGLGDGGDQGMTSMSTRRSVRHLDRARSASALPSDAATTRSVEMP